MPDLDMTPYAAFVWPAWAISALVLVGLVVRVAVAARRWKAELRALDKEDAAEGLPQVAQSAVGQETGPQAGRSPVGPKQ
ncbi:heme exporter protein CcmD [Brevundimonas sp.]|uniref:heme exporter protein CcmD n=1 Tax=Brevundimonas sp. TaxID=1871086 RepID=UPI001A185D55|nr:heme exporter protein CcmD [Brevundimonas sp.]MBJ7486094.1 heme exporter protein CcmD [Brevundimonas sp.]